MYRRDARDQIINNPGFYLRPDKQSRGGRGGRISYVCPLCGSGEGKNGTGITTKDGVHFTCWAGCYKNSDIIDIIALEYGIEGAGYNAKLEKACALYGINYSDLEADPGFMPGRNATPGRAGGGPASEKKQEAAQDYMEFFRECASRRKESDYMSKQRGISDRVQELYLVGFCPDWRSPAALRKGFNPPKSPRAIIPTSRYSYIARDVRAADTLKDSERKYAKTKEGPVHLFNLKALEDAKEPVFIVEGEIDALSIIEIGYSAVALGSVNNAGMLLKYLSENKPGQPLLIAMDADEKGQQAAGKLMSGLRDLGIDAYRANISGGYKDANERLVADRDGLRAAAEDAIESARDAQEAEKREYLETTSNAFYLDAFVNGIADSANTPYIPTGFSSLDRVLDGGLYEGLYTVGAISSLGKTTLVLQIADQIAKQGRDVLIFSLEMARNELISKSISRLTAQLALENNLPLELAKTVRGITVYNFYRKYSEKERKLIDDAISAYGEYAEHIRVFEGIGDIGVEQIRASVSRHISLTGTRPVVIIDYLQILAPYNERASDKQNTDKAVLELKRMSRDYKLPVISVSSFNRDNYSVSVSMAAFKESGAIEYGSDVLIGLQLKGAGEPGFDVDRAKEEKPRKVEAKILKNRNGEPTKIVNFAYYAGCNLFRELTAANPGCAGAKKQNRPKLSKREAQREQVKFAIESSRDKEGRALLVDVADALDISTRQVRNRMKELGIKFVIKDGYITDWEDAATDRENPFEDAGAK